MLFQPFPNQRERSEGNGMKIGIRGEIGYVGVKSWRKKATFVTGGNVLEKCRKMNEGFPGEGCTGWWMRG
ncbi:MAG TPA: hypothetical protein DDW85_01780 [Porphyromonadaceae bacterium]|jgi:hypothetical protein|nr:hypothetical protein [Porphyromonadaceae bacterium]